MRNLTRKLGATEVSEAQLLETFEFEKELAKVLFVLYKPLHKILRLFDAA